MRLCDNSFHVLSHVWSCVETLHRPHWRRGRYVTVSVNEIVKQRAVRRLPRTAADRHHRRRPRRSALHFDDRVRQAALEPDFSTSDRAPDCAEDPQHDTDHHEDSADGVKDRDACEITDQEKDDAEDNHGQSDPMLKTLELAVRELPDPSRSKHSGRGQAHFRHGGGSVAIGTQKRSSTFEGISPAQPSWLWAVAGGWTPILPPAVGSAGVSWGPRGRTDTPGLLD